MTGLHIGTITADDIHLYKGTILKIDNIVKLDNGYFTIKNPDDIRIKITEQYINKQRPSSAGWNAYHKKYLKNMSKITV
jgi:hypothetical protein